MTAQRLDLERAAWEAEGGLGMTLDEFQQRFSDWQFLPIASRGELAGVAIMRGPEIHVCIKPEHAGRWVTRRFLSETLMHAVRTYGVALTQVMAGNLAARRFVERLGFRPIGHTGNIITYEATA